MRKIVKFVFASLICLALVSIVSQHPARADRLQELQDQISKYQKEVDRLVNQANTLKNQIAQFDAQIKLTELKISETEEKISLLGGRIDSLEVSLQSLTRAFSTRAVETYKMARAGDSAVFLISAPDLSKAVTRFHYLQKIQEADRALLIRLQKAQNTYQEQKADQEDLQGELTKQKDNLNQQKAAKRQLLALTQNDEKKYQELISKAQAEIEAIQSILAGKGQETEVGAIAEGTRVATIIAGASACSNGGHLHFEVAKDKSQQNPANFLSPREVVWDNAPDGAFAFSGSWTWPINDPARITQGYGMTYYAGTLKYYGGSPHTGIDMANKDDLAVKAVRPGVLYRGAIGCGGGTLRYVRVKQDDGYDTYYLHVNYY